MPSSANIASVNSALKAKAKPSSPDTGMKEAYLKEMASTLTEILSATYRLTIKSHVYHWNVTGPLFKPIHELTELHYNDMFAAADVIAERIRALGQLAPVKVGDASAFAPKTVAKESGTAEAMVEDLVSEHEALVRSMREATGHAEEGDDAVTADMLTGRMAFHEKAIWMLRATISA